MLNKFILIITIAVLTVVSTACSFNHTNINKINNYQIKDYLVVETATGATITEARANAINLIAQHVFVQVQSQFNTNQTLVNNKFNSVSNNNIDLSTYGYFKYLTFVTTKKINSKTYQVTVGLTKQQLQTNITELYNSLKLNLLDSLSNVQLIEEYNNTRFLLGLITLAKSNSINIDSNVESNKVISYQKLLELKLSNAAEVTFNIIPNVTTDGWVKINQNRYKITDHIYLATGEYNCTIGAPGYHSINKNFKLESKDNIIVKAYLQQQLANPVPVMLQLNAAHLDANNLKDAIISLLPQYQMKNVANSSTKLNIDIMSTHYKVLGGYYYFTLPVQISLLNFQNVKVSKLFNITYVGSSIDSQINSQVIINKVNQFLAEITAGDTLKQF